MKIAHLILAHTKPLQLGELVSLLQHPSSDIYIHLDKKSDARQFEFLLKYPSVLFIKNNVSVHWAHYSLVQCVLNSFEEIATKEYDYINVISGQDFPIKSPNHFYNFLVENNGKEFIACANIERDWPEAAIRLVRYDLPKHNFKGKYKLLNVLNKILPAKKFPLPYDIVGRSNWFTISKKAALYILETIKANPRVVKYFRYTWASDEIIFSTILYNSPFKNKITDNLMFVNWNWKGSASGHPKILNKDDWDSIKKSDKFFARKFDLSVTPHIIDDIRTLIAE